MRCSVPAICRGRQLLHLLGVQLGLRWGSVGHAQVGADHVDNGLAVVGVVLGEVLKGVQGPEPDRGLLVAELLDGLGVAVGDLALLGQVELLLGGLQGVLHLLTRGLELALADPDLPQGHGRTDGRSGQDQQSA
jgi:hypothetical protein